MLAVGSGTGTGGRMTGIGRHAFSWLLVVLLLSVAAVGEVAVKWDFTRGTHGWVGNQQVEGLKSTSDGLEFRSTGKDPWIEGPAVDLPGRDLTQVRIRMKSEVDMAGELFYGEHFSGGRSVRFTIYADGEWHDYALMINERLGKRTRFRLDPCMNEGHVTVAWIEVEPLEEIAMPAPSKPGRPRKASAKPIRIRSGGVELVHYGQGWGEYVVLVDGVEMAAGYDGERVGYVTSDGAVWLKLKDAEADVTKDSRREVTVRARLKDDDGGRWEFIRRFEANSEAGTFEVETQVVVDKDRDVVLLPWLTIFPGLGTYGGSKDQGLFAGVEYLCDEPSSSKADIETAAYLRRAPDPLKITFPLMAIAAEGKYVGLMWAPSEMLAAVFDSPDRLYGSGAHVMALSGPGVGDLRFENRLCGHTPMRIKATEPVEVKATIIGGEGSTVVDAVRHYVRLQGIPAVPRFKGGLDTAVELLSHGWLDSDVHHDGLWRHAVWGTSFGPGPAADAAMYVDWLASSTKDKGLAARLEAARDRGLEHIAANRPYSSSVSHAHLPTAPLVFGRVVDFVKMRAGLARNALRGFNEDGVLRYRPGKADYGRTHFADHANGLGGRSVVGILEGAVLSGDADLMEDALALLDKQTVLYAGTVPRGAQTWEVPLHTPDILASAHMVKAYTLGYIISGRREYLEQARYWAWTGVPFLYLSPPTDGEVGVYGTIAVLGATNWKAPLWLGQPVQWCGLVYGSALHLLAEHDSEGPWKQIARGITATGLQMTWPLEDKERQGLLPDYFDLRAQVSLGPAINPGTVQAHVPELFGVGKLYCLRKIAGRGWFVHAPCEIRDLQERKDGVALALNGWGDKPYYVLVSGVRSKPRSVILERDPQSTERKQVEWQYDFEAGILVIKLRGTSRVRIR